MFTDVYIKNRLSLERLKPLSLQMANVSNTLLDIASLKADGILSQQEVDSMVADYKSTLKSLVQSEVVRAAAEADIHGHASETETNKKVGLIVPLILGNATMVGGSPTVFAAEAVTLLQGVPTLTSELSQLMQSFNILQ